MESWLLIAMLQLSDGSAGPTLPIDVFPSYESCMTTAESAEDIVREIADNHDIVSVFFSCVKDSSLEQT